MKVNAKIIWDSLCYLKTAMQVAGWVYNEERI